MTAAPARIYVDTSHELRLQRPLPHQLSFQVSPARFKIGRWGRRRGKTSSAFLAAMAGHGPGWEDGAPLHEGVLQGWDVVWLGKDYPQARQIWEAEIEPRLRGLVGVTLNQTERTVKILGGGTLHIRSAEIGSLMGIRGLGKDVKGVVIDEAAWLNLQYAWRHVLRPILMDNHGWAIIMSTTNRGIDGGKDEETGNVVTPSYFNRLCQDVMDGVQGRTLADGWEHFYGTASDNRKIDPSEFHALLQEYVPGSLAEAQEVYAKLLTGGAGLAFHEWRDDLHVVGYEPPPTWRWFGGVDWGYRTPYAIVLFAAGPDGDILARHEMYGKEKTSYEVGYLLGQKARGLPGPIEWLACDEDMWNVTNGGVTIGEDFQRGIKAAFGDEGPFPVAIGVPKGKGSRAARVIQLHEHLRFETLPVGMKLPGGVISDGTLVPPWAGPKLRFHRDCANCIRTIPALPIDPKNTEDVDTEAEDHAYDAVTYALISRVPRPETETVGRVPDDIHPGFEITAGVARRKPRFEREESPEDSRKQVLASGRYITGVRVGGARPHQED